MAEVRVLTYNLFIRPPGVRNNGTDDYKDERLRDFLNLLPNYDVVCLQEVFGTLSSRKEFLRTEAMKRGFNYSLSCPQPALFSTLFIDGGLMILSRYPIQQSDHYTFSARAAFTADYFAAKGVLHALVALPAGHKHHPVHVFTTHLQASYVDGLSSATGDVRQAQVQELLDFIRACTARDTHPIVVAGDLNVDSRPRLAQFPSPLVKHPDVAGDSDVYTAMMDQFRALHASCCVTDTLAFSSHGVHPVTVGDVWELPDGSVKPTDTMLTSSKDYGCQKCLDYILLMERTPLHASTAASLPPAPPAPVHKDAGDGRVMVTSEVLPFRVKNRPYTQVSDHYAVCTRIAWPQV